MNNTRINTTRSLQLGLLTPKLHKMHVRCVSATVRQGADRFQYLRVLTPAACVGGAPFRQRSGDVGFSTGSAFARKQSGIQQFCTEQFARVGKPGIFTTCHISQRYTTTAVHSIFKPLSKEIISYSKTN